MASSLSSLKLVFECSKCESQHDVSITRMNDTFPPGFPQTDLRSCRILYPCCPSCWNLPGIFCIELLPEGRGQPRATPGRKSWQHPVFFKILNTGSWQDYIMEGG